MIKQYIISSIAKRGNHLYMSFILKFASYLLLIAMCSLLNSVRYDDSSIYDAEARYDSLSEWYQVHEDLIPNDLMSDIKVLYDVFVRCVLSDVMSLVAPSDFGSYCLPKVLFAQQDENECTKRENRDIIGDSTAAIVVGVALIALIAVIIVPLLIVIGALILASVVFSGLKDEILKLVDDIFGGCLTTFVMTPTEYIAIQEGKLRQNPENKKQLEYDSQTSGWHEGMIPFFFHCNDKDMSADFFKDLDDTPSGRKNAEKLFGYLGNTLCQNAEIRRIGNKSEYTQYIGGMVVCKVPFDIAKPSGGGEMECCQNLIPYCNFIPMDKAVEDPNASFDIGAVNKITVQTYYSMRDDKLLRCALTRKYNVLWLVLGCSSVAAPVLLGDLESQKRKLIDNTRCKYLNSYVRDDYYSVGRYLMTRSVEGEDPARKSVPAFLLNNFHPFDTLVGCISDILNQLVVGDGSAHSNTSFLAMAQGSLRGIVMVLLSFYLMVVGLRILGSGGEIQRSEIMMYIMKILLVAFFGLSDIWLPSNNILNAPDQTTGRVGLYSVGIELMEKITSAFLDLAAIADPLKMCYYPNPNKDDSNLLTAGKVQIPSNEISPTASFGSDGRSVIFTPWTLLECKFINMLTWNSCHYDISVSPVLTFTIIAIMMLSGSIVFVLLGLAVFANFSGVILAILCGIFAIIAIMAFGRYLYAVLLSIITFTLLVFLAPIMSTFVLFEFTKDTFNSWLKALISFILYPGLLSTQLVLFMTVMDSVIYGNPKYVLAPDFKSQDIDFNKLCTKDNQSIFCVMLQEKKHPCIEGPNSNFFNRFIKNSNNSLSVSADALSKLLKPLLYLLFYIYVFSTASLAIGTFIAELLSIPSPVKSDLLNFGKIASLKDKPKQIKAEATRIARAFSSKK